MLVGGEWREALSGRIEEITSPFDGAVVATVPRAGVDDAGAAVTAAEVGAVIWRRTPAHERMRILLRAAQLIDDRAEQIAQTITAENGKTIREARVEAGRSGELVRLAAFEGAHLYGQTLPLDAAPGTGFDKIGFTVRQPCGIVLAITPFNYPALLALHKVAPALAAGNSVVLKPAESTPLAALAVAACFVDAGLPAGVLSVVTGHGDEIGDVLVADRRIRKISFTGSTEVGERISRHAGVKKLSLELGASCPVVILPDADLEQAASAVAAGGYANAGQVCTSVQRVVSHPAVLGDFLDALVPKVAGNPDRRSGFARHRDGHADLDRGSETGSARHRRGRCWRCTCAHRGRAGRQPSWRPPWLSVSTRRRRSARTSCSARRSRSALQPTGRALSRRSTARVTACQPESSPPTSSARSARFER